MPGKLFFVATPIGNYDDITLRAIKVLKECDILVCEEFKPGLKLLRHIGIDKKPISLNEHNEKESTEEILQELYSGKNIALFSDAGTPLFADPGHYLFEMAIGTGIEVIIIPGVSSIIPAITGSGLKVESFFYRGWLSPKTEIRKNQLKDLKRIKEVIVLLETPYRLLKLTEELISEFGDAKKVVLAYKLTTPEEKYLRGSLVFVRNQIKKLGLKGEFVFILDNRY